MWAAVHRVSASHSSPTDNDVDETVKVSIVQDGSVLRLQATPQDKSYLPLESQHMSTIGDLEVT